MGSGTPGIGTAPSRVVMHYTALYCIILHYVALYWLPTLRAPERHCPGAALPHCGTHYIALLQNIALFLH